MSSDDFLEGLRDDVVAAARRLDEQAAHHSRAQPSRRAWMLPAAAVVVLIAAVSGLLWSSSRTPVSADLEVIRQGDELVIRLTDVETRPDEIEAAARAAGLDIDVVEVPVGPSNVGKFAGASAGAFPESLTADPYDPTSAFTGFRVPIGFEAPITLQLGRAAEPGESWTLASSATAKGEPLECERVDGVTPDEVLEMIGRRGLPDPRVMDAANGRMLDDDALRATPSYRVVRVEVLTGNELFITVIDRPDRIPPQPPQSREGCD